MSTSISGASVAAAIDSCSDCCTLYNDCADCSTLSLPAATPAPWPPSSSDLLACCAAAAAIPHPPQPAPSLWQQQQKDCFQCAATDTMGVSTNEEVAAAAAAAKSHLAWCCDDAECLPSTTAAARTSSPGTSLAYDSTTPAYSAPTTTATSTPVEEDWMRWSAAALATATAAAGPRPPSPCLDPSCHPVGGVVVSPPSGFSTLADCPSCTAGPSTSSSTGTPVTTTTTTTTTTDDHHQHGLDQDGLPQTDLDELLNGLDEETIQDILNCCCCDTALHDQPATFDPASHTQHQQLPQHIHCHDPHDLPPPPPLPPPLSLGAFAPAPAPVGGGRENALDVSVTNFLGHRQQPGFSSTSAAAASSSTTTQPLPPFYPGYSVAQSLLPTSPSTITTCAGSSSSSNRTSYLEEGDRPLSNSATTRQTNTALPPTTPSGGDGGHRITKPLRCEWRTCTASFGTHEALVAHVLTTHLATPSSLARNITTTATAATTTTTAAAATGSDDVMSHPLLLSRLASALIQLTEEANGPREVANAVPAGARGIDEIVRALVEAVRGASASGGIAAPSSSSHAGGGDAVRSLDKTGLPRPRRSPHLHPPINSHSHSHPHFRGRPSSRPPPSHGTTHSHTHHHARGVPKHHHHPYGAARAHAAAVEAAKQKKEEEEAEEEEDGEEQEAAATTTTTRTRRRGPDSSGSEVLSGDGSRKRRRVVGTARAAAAPTLSSLATEMATTTTTNPPSPASLYDLAPDLRSAGTVEGNGDALAIAEAAAALSRARGTTTVAVQSPPLIDTPPSPSAVSSASVRGDSSEGSQNQAQAQLQHHPCRWRGCPAVFETTASLMEHLSTVHVGAGKARYTCEWDGCERSTGVVCFGEEQQQLDCGDGQEEEGEWRNRGATVDEETFESARDARDDKGVFRQRQKVMRHLQMHTGDRPYACQVCGKTFSESLTLTQHMRVHTQERPYECDHPGCGKAFALASALTIHKRTHTGSRPFTCPFPGCSAAFSESSNLSKHLRVHSTERKYPCLEPGCGKAFARSDQLKRHRRVHEKENEREREKETG